MRSIPMYIRPPCKVDGKDCAARRVGCQVECERYKAYSKVIAERREQTMNRLMLNGYTADASAKVKKRAESSMPKATLQAAIKR